MKDVTGVLEVRGSCLVQKQKDWTYSTYISICSDGDINPCLGKQWLLAIVVLLGVAGRLSQSSERQSAEVYLAPSSSALTSIASGMFSATVTCLYFRLTVDHCR